MNVDRWQKLTLAEQMGHIGSEITRARVWQERGNIESCNNAIERASNLIEMTLNNTTNNIRLNEITRLREVALDNLSDNLFHQYGVSLQYLENYCNQFATIK